MTAKTTVTIEAVHPDGTDLTNQRVVVQLIHGGAGGTVDGELIAERTTVPLSGAGPWSIALYPTAAISPSGCFYRFTIDNSSPTINRDISVPSSGPVSWTDAAILLENPDPPVTVPAAISGDPLDVLRVNAEGTGYELAPASGGAGTAPEPLLLHHSFRRCDDGPAAVAGSNGQGLLGPTTLTDISAFLPLVYQEAQVDGGALRLRAVSPATLGLAFSNAILGTAPVGRGGFMVDEFGAATVAADCDGVVFISAGVTTSPGDGYALLLRLTGDGLGDIDAEIALVTVAAGVYGADLDTYTLPRLPLAGDTAEIRIDGTASPATITGFWNGEEVATATDATTDPSTFSTAAVFASTDGLADPTKWLPAVTDIWFTDGGAWWPGSLPGAGGGGTVDVVSNVATNTILGRTTAGTGNSEELAPSAVRALVGVRDSPQPLTGYSGSSGYAYFVPGGIHTAPLAAGSMSQLRVTYELWEFDEDTDIVPAIEWGAAAASGKGVRLWTCTVNSAWQPQSVFHDFGFLATDTGTDTVGEWTHYLHPRGRYCAMYVTDGAATFKSVQVIGRHQAIGGSVSGTNSLLQPAQGGSGSGSVGATSTTAFTVGTAVVPQLHRIKVRKV